MKNNTYIKPIFKPYSHSCNALFMSFFMIFVGTLNTLYATNQTDTGKIAQLYVGSNTSIYVANNTLTSENFKTKNFEHTTIDKPSLDYTFYIVKGTIYYIDSTNNHLQIIEINNIQNNVAKNTTQKNSSTNNTTSSVTKPNAETIFIKTPFGNTNSNYSSKPSTCVVTTTQNQIKTHKKAYLNTSRFSLLLFPTIKKITFYNNNNIFASSAFCRYRFSLPPPFSLV